MKVSTIVIAPVTAAALGLAVLAAQAWQQPGAPPHAKPHQPPGPPPGAVPPDAAPGQPLPDLVAGLEATPGCLGVERAATMSGKNVIFAWFEDKSAVERWYYGEMHQQVMDMFFPDRNDGEDHPHKPLASLPEDFGPIMAIASVTWDDHPDFKETTLPVSQIAIELYAPISGGIYLGGRFAPEGVKVADMRDLTPAGSGR